MQKLSLGLTVLLLTLAGCSTFQSDDESGKKAPSNAGFAKFYKELRADVAAQGHDPKLLDAAFAGSPQPINSVISAEKAQPETTRTFASYVGPMLSRDRIAAGTSHMLAHRKALSEVQDTTGVPMGVVVALWGIETNFGKSQGNNPVIPSLVTLAWKSPRGDYFRREVMASLEVLERTGMKPSELKGSWAGALGQCQFMPSSYLAYARDGDGDGKIDIWTNEDDVFASAGTYLKAKGWVANQPWRVTAPKELDVQGIKLNARGLSDPISAAAWEKRGVVLPKSFKSGHNLRYYQPEPNGPAFLLGPNFEAVLRWNNSSYFAYSVLSLSDVLQAEARN